MKKLLQLPPGRRGVVRDERAGNDLGVRVPLCRVHAPDNACVWDRAVGGDDEASTRHAARRAHVARRELRPLGEERGNAFRGKVELVCFEALILTPDITAIPLVASSMYTGVP